MPIDPAPRADDRPAGRGHAAAQETVRSEDRDPPPGWAAGELAPPEQTAPSHADRLLGWLQPTPAELVGLILLVLGSVVATLVWWGQSVTAPAGTDQLGAAGVAVPSEDHPAGAMPGAGGAGDDHPSVGVNGAEQAGAGDGPAGVGSAAVAVTVHVSGAVTRPGLVTLPAGGRVGDAVVAAGGLTAEADTTRVNLARALSDGEHVHLPRIGEEVPAPLAPVGTGGADPAGAADGATDDVPLDLNRASAAELEELPGIGPTRAAAIVEYRERHGPFAVPGDLRGVSGIGEATFQNLAPLVVVR